MSDIRFNRWLHQSGTGGVSQDSSGNIGIGTTVPTMALDVRGDINVGDTININNASGIISATTITATTGTFSGNISVTGNVSIAGTLTYEDVSNIDAVGIITAQSDIIVGGGLTVTGISTFNNDVKLLDSDKLKFGIGEDLQIYHNGNNSYIDDIGDGDLYVRSNRVRIGKYTGEDAALFNADGSVELYYDNSKKFETTNTGAVVTGILTATTFSGNLTGNVTGDLTGNLAGITSIAGISSSISDTAVDVFVYDTSKDSDGGAWRKRTQNTSWYNETLGTATRGTRKEFPTVAVIVSTTTKVTIYDGDDPDLPMWMVFTAGSNGMSNKPLLQYSGQNGYHLAALNGVLVLGHDTGSDNYGSPIINFISEYIVRMDPHSTEGGIFNGGVAQRNDNVGYGSPGQIIIINSMIKDVAMTVLPNAAIDPSTGLPIPTIAVATNGGVSVIKDDGIVVDITSSKAVNDVDLIHFDKSGRLYFAAQASSSVTDIYQFNRYVIPSSDISNNVYEDGADATYFSYATSGSFANVRPNFNARYNDGTNEDITSIVSNNDGGVVGNVNGLSLFVEDYLSQNNGMVAYAATSYNTGYMHGDIRGAFLSDTYTGEDFGPEIVTGGDFSNASQWTLGTGWSINGSGQAVHTGSAGYIEQAGTFTGGRYYQMTADLISGNAAHFGMTNRNEPGVAQPHNQSTLVDVYCAGGSGKIVAMWKQRSGVNLNTINLYANNNVTIDNVSVKEISRFHYDRSVNNKPLALFGSLTQTPVATGADLVAYSGFSASNYLEQSYNSDFNFGTGSFSIMAWFKLPTSGSGVLLYRGTADGDETFRIYMDITNYGIYFDYGGGSGYSYLTNTSDRSAIWNEQWNQFVCHATASGEVRIYVNGISKSVTVAGPPPSTFSSTATNVFHIGSSYGGINPFPGSVALFRVSASIPSPEQIKKIYEDEKHLFQENAKATLYGSSNAVTALGYDDTTNILHVGTSAGRSEFQGLRRINNTTDAVTTAISASNRLVAEQ